MRTTKKSNGALIARDLLIYLVLSAVLIVAVCLGISLSHNSNKAENLKIIENGVRRAAIQCYAAEGIYPDNLEYLVENYHLYTDEEHYIIHYSPISSNIMPDIQVIPK